jgi:hypothetical protein
MRQVVVAALLLSGWAARLSAQAAEPAEPGARSVTVLSGVGNALGWYGVQAERYVGDRMSLFAGLGYTPPWYGVSGIAGAGGARLFTSGTKHRGFLEFSVSQIAVGGLDEQFYGPGLQAGWQFVSRGGFTLMASAGAGYILSDVGHPVQALIGLGVGYTWRRQPP